MSTPRWRTPLILGLYAILTAIITYPTLAHLGTHIPGSEGDALNHLWTFQWVKTALLSGQSPFYTHLLYHPHGVSLRFHNIAWVHIALWLPLQALIGAAPAYSLLFIANFTFNAIALYHFAREETASETAAFIAGLIGGFWPYALSHHNHPNLILIGWIPLAMLYLRRTIRQNQKQNIIASAVCLALIGLTRWQLLIMSLLPLTAYLIYQLAQQPLTRPLLARLTLTGLLAALLMAPLATPLLLAQFGRDNPDDLFVTESPNQTDLLAYLLPNRYHPLWGQAAFPLYDNFSINKTFTPTLGYTTLLLLLLALIKRTRQSSFWLLLAALTILLALGPSLRFNGNFYGPLPYRWLQDIPLVQLIRHPDRLNVLLALPIAIAAAWGITALPTRHLSWLAGLLILTESLTIYPLYPLDVPPWYQQIAASPETYALLDIPMDPRSYDKEYMLYQLTHGKPLVGGHVSRLPREALTFIESLPLLQQIESRTHPPRQLPNVSHQMNLLAQADIRYLILHKKFLSRQPEQDWQAWLIQPPQFEDDALLVYDTTTYNQPPPITQPLLTIPQGTSLGLINTTITPTTIPQAGTLDIQISWGSHQSPTTNPDLCFHLQTNDTLIPLATCTPLSPTWPPSQWGPNQWVHTSHHLSLSPYLPGGQYQLLATITAADPAPLGTITLAAHPRQFTPPQPQTTSQLTWPGHQNLIGYNLNPAANTLHLTLYWQAQQRTNTSYKYFIHARNQQTDTITAQVDTIPQNWTYPTNWWEAGEYITDTISLPLPPGTYDLQIGWYEPETGQRLPVHPNAAATPYPDQIAPLTTITLTDPP